ncbi:LOW QUALITY PROTEIN: gastrokine-1 [Spheniscus humboldti]
MRHESFQVHDCEARIVIASLLGVFLAPALANKGYIATKAFSKNTCIIAKMDKRFLLDKWFPAPPQGHKIVTTILLGLLTPALADYMSNTEASKQITVAGGYQILTINREEHVATIKEKSTRGSWKTIWNYDTGLIASKVLPERTCFISLMNRKEMPSFDALARLAEENRNLKGQGQPAKEITFIIKRPVCDLRSYRSDIFAMCRGLSVYMAYEVYRECKQMNYVCN